MEWEYTYSSLEKDKKHLCLEIAGVAYFIDNMKGICDRKIEVSIHYVYANAGTPIQDRLLAKVDTLKEAEMIVHNHIKNNIAEMQEFLEKNDGGILE